MSGFLKPGTQHSASGLFGRLPTAQGVQSAGFGQSFSGASANAGQPTQGFTGAFGVLILLQVVNLDQLWHSGYSSRSGRTRRRIQSRVFHSTSESNSARTNCTIRWRIRPARTDRKLCSGQFSAAEANQSFPQSAGQVSASASPFGKVEAANGSQNTSFSTGFQPVPASQNQPKPGAFPGFGPSSQQPAVTSDFPVLEINRKWDSLETRANRDSAGQGHHPLRRSQELPLSLHPEEDLDSLCLKELRRLLHPRQMRSLSNNLFLSLPLNNLSLAKLRPPSLRAGLYSSHTREHLLFSSLPRLV